MPFFESSQRRESIQIGETQRKRFIVVFTEFFAGITERGQCTQSQRHFTEGFNLKIQLFFPSIPFSFIHILSNLLYIFNH